MMLRSTTLLLLIFLSGCASTEITSVRDPEYAVEIFRNPVVHASVIGLKYQKALEAALIKSFSKRGISSIPGTSVFLPTRKLEEQNLGEAFLESGADCLVTVRLKEGSTTLQNYEITVLSRSKGKIVWVGDSSTKIVYGSDIGTDDMTLSFMFDSLSISIVDRLIQEQILAGP